MAVTPTPIFPQVIRNWGAQILNATASLLVNLATGGANGTKIESIMVSSTDTSSRDLAFTMSSGATVIYLTTVNIPITAGNTNAIPSVDILRNAQIPGLAYDSNGNKYLYLANGWTLQINTLTTVTAAKAVQVFAQGGDF